jgi:hypothetical protein
MADRIAKTEIDFIVGFDRSGSPAFCGHRQTLIGFDVDIDAETSDRAWVEIRALAMLEGLTAYDAAYLGLAMRRNAKLVSKDADLLSAARRRKVPILDLSV